MATDTIVSNLVINKLTKAQYEAIEHPSDTEIYLVPDDTSIPTDLKDLHDDSTHRLVTDTEKAAWNGKADKVQNATANNVALLDANGNCIDSGKAFTPQGIGAVPSSTDVLLANRVWYSGSPKMKTYCPRNVLCLTYDETYMLPTNTDGSYVTTKTLTDLDFDPFGQILYPPNGFINAESYSIYMLAYHSLGLDLRSSFNMTSSLTVNRAVYLVMVPQSNGRCKLHTSPISQTLPTTEDGLVYKFLGHATSANNCCLEFSKPCYYFKDGQIREWTNAGTDILETKKQDKTSIVSVDSNASSLTCETDKYYRLDTAVDTFSITLPTITDVGTVKSVVIFLTTGTTPAITISSTHPVYYNYGFNLDAGKTYEINALWNGAAWVVANVEIVTS